MTPTTDEPGVKPTVRIASPRWIAILLVATIAAAWCNGLGGEFILDDKLAVLTNPSIRRLWALSTVLQPPNHGETVTGRPLLNLSFALNWAISGKSVWSYHVGNVLIHAAAMLVWFGLVRRTLRTSRLAPRFGADATWIAMVVAAAWAVHPLLTESVTYVSQRAESLAALCYLTVLYALITSVDKHARVGLWQGIGVMACLAGVATKETVASAPMIALLYDRTFIAGSLREAWRRRSAFYLSLFATWLLLGWLVMRAGDRGHTAGFGLEIDSWHYALTQVKALWHYAALAAWPAKLVLDYGFAVVTSLGSVAGPGLVIVMLLVAVGATVRANMPVGVLGIASVALLAPSSSFIPVVTQTMAEHRMYLPLAMLVLLMVGASYVVVGRRGLVAVAVASVACGMLTAHRNRDYRTAIGMWHDTIAKAPDNARAYMELGTSLLDVGRAAEAIPVVEQALSLRPETPKAECNLGVALSMVGRYQEALPHFLAAANGLPDRTEPLFGIGFNLVRLGRATEAVSWFQRVVRLTPNDAEAHKNLAVVYEQIGQYREATAEFESAIRCDPRNATVRFAYGNLLGHTGDRTNAIIQYRAAIAIDPKFVNAHLNLGARLIDNGELEEGIKETKLTLSLDPENVSARTNLQRAEAAR